MTDDKTHRGRLDDQIGKVFFAVGRDVRQCLVCGELFTQAAAADHTEADRYPVLELRLPDSPQGGNMSLRKEYVRDGNRKIIGSITSGFSGGTSDVVRDASNQITGRTSERFKTTRDAHGNLVSTNSSDPGLLIRRK